MKTIDVDSQEVNDGQTEKYVVIPKKSEDIANLPQFENLSHLFAHIKLKSLNPKILALKLVTSASLLSVLAGSLGLGFDMPKSLKMGILSGGFVAGVSTLWLCRDKERDLAIEKARLLEQIDGSRNAVEVYYRNLLSPAIIKEALKEAEREAVLKQLKEIYDNFDWVEWLNGVTSIMIYGSSGGAKSTLAKFLLGIFPEPFQMVVLDIHYNDYPDDVKPYVLNEREEIIAYMKWFLEVEKPRRLENWKERKKNVFLINFLEEIGDIVLQTDDPDELNIIKRFNSSAIATRKLDVLNMGVNQIRNSSGSGLKGIGDVLTSYASITVGSTAIKWAKITGVDKDARAMLTSNGYNCLVNDEFVVKHPTHGHYDVVKRENPPANIQDFTVLEWPEFLSFKNGLSLTTSKPIKKESLSVNDRDDYLYIRDRRQAGDSWETILQSLWGADQNWSKTDRPNSHKSRQLRLSDKYLEDWVCFLVDNGETNPDTICRKIYGKVNDERMVKIQGIMEAHKQNQN